MSDFYAGLDVAFPQEWSPDSSEREVHCRSGSCGTSMLWYPVLVDVLQGNFYVVSNKPLCRLSFWTVESTHLPALAHRSAVHVTLPLHWPVSGCVPNRLYPALTSLRTEALWGGIIFQFSLYMLLKMQLILKRDVMDAMVICKYAVIAPIATHTLWYWQVVRWGKRNSAMWSLWNLLMLLICLTPKSILCLEPPSPLWYVVFSRLCLFPSIARFISALFTKSLSDPVGVLWGKDLQE